MKFLVSFLVGAVVTASLIFPDAVSAQNTASNPTGSQDLGNYQEPSRNTYLGFGFSPVVSYINDGPSLMYSLMLGQKLSSGIHLEGNAQIFGASRRLFERPMENGVFMNNIVTGNIQILTSPFSEGIFAPLSFGVGLTTIWYNSTFEIRYPVDISSDYTSITFQQGIYSIENWRVGGLLTAEYDIELHSAVHLGVRAQWMPLLNTTFFEKNNLPQISPRLKEWFESDPSYSARQFQQVGSLGAFLRVSF